MSLPIVACPFGDGFAADVGGALTDDGDERQLEGLVDHLLIDRRIDCNNYIVALAALG